MYSSPSLALFGPQPHGPLPSCFAVVIESAVRGLSSPIAFVSAIACAIAGVLLRVTAAAAAS